MPWRIKKKGDRFCVERKDTGEKVKCHKDRSDAIAHLRALYANQPKAEKTIKSYTSIHNRIVIRVAELKGGAGSGNKNHQGRPGMVGGSSSLASSKVLKQISQTNDFTTEFVDKHKSNQYNLERVQNDFGEEAKKNLFSYVFDDKVDSSIHATLNQVLDKAGTTKEDVISYRGMSVPKDFISNLLKQPEFDFKEASSFTNSNGVAWDFAKQGGYRDKNRKKVPLLLKVLVPKGSKMAILNVSFGVGQEHLISGKVKIAKVEPYRNGYRALGVLENSDSTIKSMTIKGGQGSGNFHHEGRIGQVGGSSTFSSPKTILEARERLSKIGINVTDLIDYREPFDERDLRREIPNNAQARRNLVMLRSACRTFEIANEKGMLIPEKLVIGNQSTNQNAGKKERFNSLAWYTPSKMDITMNTYTLSTGGDSYLKEYQQKKYAQGWFSTDNPDHVIRHEYAHFLNHLNSPEGYFSRTHNSPLPDSEVSIAKKVSVYGSTSPHEFIAETATGLMDGRKYGEDVMNLYKKYHGTPVFDLNAVPRTDYPSRDVLAVRTGLVSSESERENRLRLRRKLVRKSLVSDTIEAQCLTCTRWQRDGTCEAFPKGIPVEILLNDFDHRQPYPGDNNLRFEVIPGESSIFEEPEENNVN